MKTHLKLRISFLTLAILGFTYSGIAQMSQVDISRQDLLIHSPSEQKIIFRTLTPENCHLIWLQKMQHNVSCGKLNSNQTALIIELTGRLNPKIYDNDTLNDSTFDSFYDIWIEKARVSFTADEFFRSFVQLKNFDDSTLTILDGGTIDCSCSTKSDWCGFPDDDETCKITDCREYNRGCGTLWRHACNGRCTLFGELLGSRNPKGMY